MKFLDFGDMPDRKWFQNLLNGLRRKLTFEDNLDCEILTVNIGTSETEVGHALGRAPRYIIPVASFPNGTSPISWSRPPAVDKVWLTRSTAGMQTLILM